MVLALALSLVWQGLLAQAHHHFTGPGAPAAFVHPATAHGDHKAPTDHESNCPICAEIGQLGNYLLPGLLDLHIRQPVAYRLFLPPSLHSVWQVRHFLPHSRAPPPGYLA